MAQSFPSLPQTPGAGHSAASPEHYSFTPPPPFFLLHRRYILSFGADFQRFFSDVVLITFKKAGGGHTSSYGGGSCRPIAHCGYLEPQCIAVPLIGKVSPIQEGGMIKMLCAVFWR